MTYMSLHQRITKGISATFGKLLNSLGDAACSSPATHIGQMGRKKKKKHIATSYTHSTSCQPVEVNYAHNNDVTTAKPTQNPRDVPNPHKPDACLCKSAAIIKEHWSLHACSWARGGHPLSASLSSSALSPCSMQCLSLGEDVSTKA